MFERFTERARQVVVLAQEEARTLKHNYIGTEHILLGLLREEQGLAAQVLASFGITVERVRAQIVGIVGSGEEQTTGQIPFTPRAKKVLELALREALALGHNYIGTEHILLALVNPEVAEAVAARVLLDLDAGAEKLRTAVIAQLRGPETTAHIVTTSGQARRHTVDLAWLEDLSPVLDRLGAEIRDKLGRPPDTGDLLLVLACAHDTTPAHTLAELGVDLDVLWGTIERARKQLARTRAQERRQLAEQLAEIRIAKEHAIESKQMQRAAELRDQERTLTEQQADARHRVPAEALDEIRRRLGIPQTIDPPPEPS